MDSSAISTVEYDKLFKPITGGAEVFSKNTHVTRVLQKASLNKDAGER